jgi:hypothetical protein
MADYSGSVWATVTVTVPVSARSEAIAARSARSASIATLESALITTIRSFAQIGDRANRSHTFFVPKESECVSFAVQTLSRGLTCIPKCSPLSNQ